MFPDTVSWEEIVFTLLILALFGYGWWFYHDALATRIHWSGRGMNGIVDLSTRSSVQSARWRLIGYFALVIAGLTAMSLPPVIYQPPVDPAWVPFIVRFAFLVFAVVMLIDSARARNVRNELLELEADRKRRDQTAGR